MLLEKITKIQNKTDHHTFIIVEGKRDKKVLEQLHFKNIITISGKSHEKLLRILRQKKTNRVAILTDFDKEGERQCKELCRLLEKNKIKIDFYTREKFKQTFNIHKIEELSFITKQMDSHETNGPPSINKILNRNKFLKRKNNKKRKRRH